MVMRKMSKCNGRRVGIRVWVQVYVTIQLAFQVVYVTNKPSRIYHQHRQAAWKYRSMPKSPFKPLRKRKTDTSIHPKSVINRSYESAKRGLDIAIHRDTVAFRTAKSRTLKKLRDREDWDRLPEKERAREEKAAVDVLTVKYDAKKRGHLQQWRRKVEAGEVSEDEQEEPDDEEEDEQADDVVDGQEDDWVDMEDEDEELPLEDVSMEIQAMKKIAGVGWAMKLAKLEAIAMHEADEWEDIYCSGK